MSVESSDSEQHNEGSQEPGPEEPEQTTGHQRKEVGRYHGSSARLVVFPPSIESRMVVLNVFSLGRGRYFQSRLYFGESFPHKYLLDNPSRYS